MLHMRQSNWQQMGCLFATSSGLKFSQKNKNYFKRFKPKFQGQLNKARKPNFLIVDKNTSITEIEDAFRSFCGRKDLIFYIYK